MSEAAIITQTNSNDCEQPIVNRTDPAKGSGNTAGLSADDITK